MKNVRISFFFVLLMVGLCQKLIAQSNLYFPPTDSDIWETTSLEELNWCDDKLADLLTVLDDNDTRAFMVLKDGKIVVEEYFDGFKQDSSWVWFSAAKSLMSFLIGIAQENNFLSIDDSSNDYLGEGWSSLTPSQESAIKVRNHLSMSTGIDFNVENTNCTDPSCLEYLNPPGEHWYYHNATYSILREILESATGNNLNIYTLRQMHNNIGMDGFWLRSGFVNLYFSTARAMARFGLLMLNNGNWDEQVIMQDKDYFNQMITSSQLNNPSYGYLWWLNGQSSFKLPGSDLVFPGSLDDNFPDDMYCAVGAQSQLLIIIPSQSLVVVRMGLDTGNGLVPLNIIKAIGESLKEIMCSTTSLSSNFKEEDIVVYPNPSSSKGFKISSSTDVNFCKIYNLSGQLVFEGKVQMDKTISPKLQQGHYYIQIYRDQELLETQSIEIF